MTDNQTNSYQDILDKYAESISSKDNPQIPQEKIIPEPELEPITPPEPILTPEEETLLKSEPSVEPETVLNPPEIEAPPVTEAIILPPPQIELPLEPSEPMPKKENHFFKYLFFLSLIIFIIVLVLVIISFINSQKPISNSRDIPNNNISPTSLPVTFCEINDQKHAVGTTFPANDSCNTCTCGEDLTINCTTKTCDLTPTKSATISASPTKSATTSANLLPSELISLVKSKAAVGAKTTADKVIIGQSRIIGDYAQIAFNYSDGAGAIYWAAKVNNVWKIVTGGQEPPACSVLLPYKFPSDFECIK